REAIAARRGGIFDSTGMLMAGTVQTQTLFVDPKFMQDQFQKEGHSLVEMDDAVAKLARCIDKDPFELSQLLGDRAEARFVKIAEQLDETTVREIEKLDLPGVGTTPTNQRYYPMGSIGAHVLGAVRRDGVGLEGLEMRFEKQLAGKDGFKRTLRDFRGRPLAVAAEDYLPAQHGQHLILTLDANIQMIAEQELAAACAEYNAKRAEVIVMEPRTGDVLALANWPTFNPENLDDSTPDLRRNRSLTDPYEPGSTIKPFIVGPAMSWNLTRPNEVWPIQSISWETPYGRKITDVHAYGPLSTWDVLVKSSNIGMSMLGERLGNPRLHEALVSFGFGRPTRVDLPGEDPGLVNPLRQWSKYSTESIAQGYELMVTPIQLARAFCAYANGGRLVDPRIVKGFLDAEGNIVKRFEAKQLKLMPQAVDPLTAAAVKRILCDTVIRGTGSRARSITWNLFGKTGTAHISQGKGGYSQAKFNSSFVGGAPAENPKLIIALIIHEPDRKLAHYGGVVSAPAAGRVLERSLAYLQVPASPDLPPPPPAIANVLWNYNEKLYSDRTARAE
ncbi:MAG TPA: penicillin-binding protein 2, partial [Tepidisphaeraceae bacterium]|nr:penicillin-binding protein 2 [Tepidisphaeraceae bacterium]